jgi:glycosyltransferase involved in cell wall biosynthesis
VILREFFPMFSVLIPTYNRARFVTSAIDSVLQQTFKDYEIIVIDDGSTDNTLQALQKYGTRTTVIRQPNSGVSAARNKGVEIARGQWVAFLDSDDEWDQNYLISQFEHIRANPDAVAFVTNALEIHPGHRAHTHFQTRMLGRFGTRSAIRIRRPFRAIIDHPHWYLQSMVVRRDVLLTTRLFDPALAIAEDLDVITQLALVGEFGFDKRVFVRIFRRTEKLSNLASAQGSLTARKSFDAVFERLDSEPALTFMERLALARVRSANQRALGNLLLAEADRKQARACYKQALMIYPSMKSLIKYVASLFSARLVYLFGKRQRLNAT